MDTFAALHSSICDSRFDLDQPISKFLFVVAKRKAVDQLRQQRNKKNSSTVSIEEFGHHLEDTDIGSRWKEILGEQKAEIIRVLFLDFLSSLPPAQRQVAQIMADNFPEKISYEEYIETIRERTGEMVTAVKVKSALANIREKFETILKAKGIYDGRK